MCVYSSDCASKQYAVSIRVLFLRSATSFCLKMCGIVRRRWIPKSFKTQRNPWRSCKTPFHCPNEKLSLWVKIIYLVFNEALKLDEFCSRFILILQKINLTPSQVIVDEHHKIARTSDQTDLHRSAKVRINYLKVVLRSTSARREWRAGELLCYAYFAVQSFGVIL